MTIVQTEDNNSVLKFSTNLLVRSFGPSCVCIYSVALSATSLLQHDLFLQIFTNKCPQTESWHLGKVFTSLLTGLHHRVDELHSDICMWQLCLRVCHIYTEYIRKKGRKINSIHSYRFESILNSAVVSMQRRAALCWEETGH